MGQPSKYSQRIADQICESLAEGQSLRRICAADGMPRLSSIFRWLESNQPFREQYARAREIQAETLAAEILDIADESSRDTYVDENGHTRTDWEVVGRSRLRVDARKWIASKLKPKVYGDRPPDNAGADPAAIARAIREELSKVDAEV